MKYDFLVFIGRFQPYHIGHHDMALKALNKTERLIFVLGSHDRPRTAKNPFPTFTRREIIESAFTPEQLARIDFVYQPDFFYNDDKWLTSIQAGIYGIVNRKFNPNPIKIGLMGFAKDHTSYYLKKFPFWDMVDLANPKQPIVNATDIRDLLYTGDIDSVRGFTASEAHFQAILKAYEEVLKIKDGPRDEYFHLIDYKKQWAVAPYPPTFVTVDAVVTQSGNILLIKRGAMPGAGLWANPGGYIAQTETLLESAIRELKEETKIDIPEAVLRGSIAKQKTYDHPDRSQRGRTITTAFHFKLPDREYLPKVRGSDDAAKAKWFELSQFQEMRPVLFEDHYDFTVDLVGI